MTFVALRSIGEGRTALEERNLWALATIYEIVKEKKGDDRAATKFLSVGDHLVGCAIGNGTDTMG